MPVKKIEITAPVGSWESLMTAINAGAESVYFGIGKLNMRARSSINFTLKDLVMITRICKKNSVRTYLTMNTVIYDEEIREMKKIVDSAKKNGIDAIIASDHSVIQYARSVGMTVHMSTQTNITKLEAVKLWAPYADVIVMARELSLKQVASLTWKIKSEKMIGPSGEL